MYRSSYSIPFFFKKSRYSSWNVLFRWCSAWFSMYPFGAPSGVLSPISLAA